MKVLVWQWGRRGAGPRFAVELAAALRRVPGVDVVLSLSEQVELLRGAAPPRCDLLMPTYTSKLGFVRRLLQAPFATAWLTRRLRELRPDVAVCAMPGPLDLLLLSALRRCGVPIVVMVHDADAHPGDGMPLQMWLQRSLTRKADAVATLSKHVLARLRQQGAITASTAVFVLSHPPLIFGPPPHLPFSHNGRIRLLFFGRLLSYKGLDLLATALQRLGPRDDMELRVVGCGPESSTLDTLRALPGVVVQNRWLPEAEVAEVIAWADVLLIPYREATQSGPAAAALAANRFIIATRVGGLMEQLGNEKLATLCDPDTASLAAALRDRLDAPRLAPQANPHDPVAAWHDLAEALLQQITTILPVESKAAAAPGWLSA